MAQEAIDKQSQQELEAQIQELLNSEEFRSVSGDPITLVESSQVVNPSKSVQIMRDLAALVADQKEKVESNASVDSASGVELGAPEVFDDVNDEELNAYLLSEEEIAWKTAAWERINKNYLQEVEEKQRLLESLGPDATRKPKKKGKNLKSNTNNPSSVPSSSNVPVNAKKEVKKISTKINYANEAAKFLIEGMMEKLMEEETGEKQETNQGKTEEAGILFGKRSVEQPSEEPVKRNRLLEVVEADEDDEEFDEEDEEVDETNDGTINQRTLRKQLGIGRFQDQEEEIE
jgi:hypothetical protein